LFDEAFSIIAFDQQGITIDQLTALIRNVHKMSMPERGSDSVSWQTIQKGLSKQVPQKDSLEDIKLKQIAAQAIKKYKAD
jgi:hypothetical protein